MAPSAVHKDIPYCQHSECCSCVSTDSINKHSLDLFLPESSSSKVKPPLVFFVHGGGWRRGHKNGWKHYLSSYDTNLFIYLVLKLFGVYNNVGRAFSRAGYACIVPSYRLAWTPLCVFAFELLISLFFSFATIWPLLAGTYLLSSTTLMRNSRLLRDDQWPTLAGFSLPVYGLLSCSTLVLWLIISLRYRVYGRSVLVFLWGCLVILILYTFIFTGRIDCKLLNTPFCSLLLIAVTYLSLLVNYQLKHGLQRNSFKESLHDIHAALRWSVQHGIDTGQYDSRHIYVSGHSAGAHLGMMLLLDQVATSDLKRCIKGFIGMSGAYDITQMTDWLSRQLYIKPAFGPREGESWETSSPLFLLPNTNSLNHSHLPRPILPPCLLLTAVSDFGLGVQAEQLAALLKKQGCQASHVTLDNHNHFSVISLFGQSVLSNMLSRTMLQSRQDPWELCLSFIQKLQEKSVL
jgi:acetyl esterase/lipase